MADIDPADVIAGLRVQLEWHQAREKRLRAAGTAFVVAFEQRFKPTGIEDEYAALRAALGKEEASA